MRRRSGLLSLLFVAFLTLLSLPAGATTVGYDAPEAPGAGGVLDELISVDTITGQITPLGITEPDSPEYPGQLIVGTTGRTEGNFTIAGMDIVWGGFLGGSYGRDILLYDRESGRFEFRAVGSDGFAYLFWEATGTRGWSHVVPGDYDGNGITDLLFYKASTGLMRFYTIEPDGTFRAMSSVMYGNRGWTQMVPGDYDDDGSDDLLWYRATDGLMRFYEVSGESFRPMTAVMYGNRNWSQIPSGDFDGDGRDDLMYYRANDGLYRFYTLSGAGRFAPISDANHTDQYWAQIMQGTFDADAGDDLVFYKPGVIRAMGFDPVDLYTIADDAAAPDDEILTVLDWDPFN